jgi:L-ribulose-5-phosphate 4-epimerase
MYADIKNSVLKANIDLVKNGLVLLTFGNASAIDREKGIVAIKPSGVSYEKMSIDDIVIINLDGKIIEGSLKPSSDTNTHIEIYKRLNSIKGIVHTHSSWATIWAQSEKAIPCLGTTHADHFYGEIPCTRKMTNEEIKGDYEKNTGIVISECYNNIDPFDMPAILVNNHGPFTFGNNVESAVYNAIVLEEVAKMAFHNIHLSNAKEIDKALLDKHFKRKHGSDAYYGQG